MNNKEKAEKVGKYYEQIKETHDHLLNFWFDHIFLRWEWWLSLVLAIGPWLIFWKFRNKESTARLMLSACFVIIISSWFDFIGVVRGLWYYSGKLIPTIPAYIPWDLLFASLCNYAYSIQTFYFPDNKSNHLWGM
ncbi:hypothetical protein ACFQDF_25430 [Ectobacillus funiculus]